MAAAGRRDRPPRFLEQQAVETVDDGDACAPGPVRLGWVAGLVAAGPAKVAGRAQTGPVLDVEIELRHELNPTLVLADSGATVGLKFVVRERPAEGVLPDDAVRHHPEVGGRGPELPALQFAAGALTEECTGQRARVATEWPATGCGTIPAHSGGQCRAHPGANPRRAASSRPRSRSAPAAIPAGAARCPRPERHPGSRPRRG